MDSLYMKKQTNILFYLVNIAAVKAKKNKTKKNNHVPKNNKNQ